MCLWFYCMKRKRKYCFCIKSWLFVKTNTNVHMIACFHCITAASSSRWYRRVGSAPLPSVTVPDVIFSTCFLLRVRTCKPAAAQLESMIPMHSTSTSFVVCKIKVKEAMPRTVAEVTWSSPCDVWQVRRQPEHCLWRPVPISHPTGGRRMSWPE